MTNQSTPDRLTAQIRQDEKESKRDGEREREIPQRHELLTVKLRITEYSRERGYLRITFTIGKA